LGDCSIFWCEPKLYFTRFLPLLQQTEKKKPALRVENKNAIISDNEK